MDGVHVPIRSVLRDAVTIILMHGLLRMHANVIGMRIGRAGVRLTGQASDAFGFERRIWSAQRCRVLIPADRAYLRQLFGDR